jgi:hypothetical protein
MLIFASIILGLTGAWIAWNWYREISFVADLDKMSGDLFDAANACGRLNDPAYEQAKTIIESIADHVTFISVPMVFRAMLRGNSGTERLKSDDADFDGLLGMFCARFNERLYRFVFAQSVFGLTIGFIASLWPIGNDSTSGFNTGAVAASMLKSGSVGHVH